MFGDYTSGWQTVWNDAAGRPIKPRPERLPGKGCDPEKWYKGYDDAVQNAKAYFRGIKDGKQGKERVPETHYHDYGTGWYRGRVYRIRQALLPILHAVGPLELAVYEVSYPDEDHVTGECYSGKEQYRRLKKEELLRGCCDYLMNNWGRREPVPTTLEEMVKVFEMDRESEWGYLKVLPIAKARKQRAQAQYERIERAAQAFSASCGHPPGTTQFIKALKKAVQGLSYRRETWNNPEVRMEEWAANQYAGGGSEGYFDDLNYVNGRLSAEGASLDEVWQYMQKKFPIMMMRHSEKQARKEKKS